MSLSPWSAAALGSAFAMWAVMMAAMMLPSAVPMVRVVGQSNRRAVADGATPTSTAMFVLGYLFIWTLFSVVAAATQALLGSLALLTPALSVSNPRIGGAILLVAGAYQFTQWKGSCLTNCQGPFTLLLTPWREGIRGGLLMGMRYGLACVGCCWALLLVLFAVGVMNLAWVAALAVVIVLEKLSLGGRGFPRLAGVGLMGWGAIVVVAG